MKKSYKIEVDCANCAQKMEDAANTVAGVANATVSFMTQKMKPARRAYGHIMRMLRNLWVRLRWQK